MPLTVGVYFLGIFVLFVTAFIAYRRDRRGRHSRRPEPSSALKFLTSYDDTYDEVELFKQLERGPILEQCLLFARKQELRLGVLSGESGSGKTSFLKAGLAPALRERGQPSIYVRFTSESPNDSLQCAVRKSELSDEQKAGVVNRRLFSKTIEALVEELTQMAVAKKKGINAPSSGSPLLLLLDQFEQVLDFDAERRRKFWSELEDWWAKTDHPTKLLISVRDDRFGRLTELQTHLGYVLTPLNNLLISKFTQPEAARVFRALALQANLEFDAAFLENTLVRDLADRDDGLVSPSELQILAWVIAQQSDGELRQFTQSAYRRLGGVAGLLERYLDQAIKTPPPNTDTKTAIDILVALCDLDVSRRTGFKTAVQIASEIEVEVSQVSTLLEWLSAPAMRLVTRVENDDHDAYELVHEKLVPALRRRVFDMQGEVAEASDLLTRRSLEWLGYEFDSRWLLNRTEFELVRQHLNIILDAGPHRDIKERLVKESRKRIKQHNWSLGIVLCAVLAFVSILGFWITSDVYAVRRCRIEAETSIDRIADPRVLGVAEARLGLAGEAYLAERAHARWSALVDGTLDDGEQSRLLASVALGMTGLDTSRATEIAQSIPESSKRSDVLASIFGQLLETAPREAAELASAISDPTKQHEASKLLARSDPAHAERIALTIPINNLKALSLAAIASADNSLSPKSREDLFARALQHANALTETGGGYWALVGIASEMARVNRSQAGEILHRAEELFNTSEKNPDKNLRDLFFLRLSRAWAVVDPQQALVVADTIRDFRMEQIARLAIARHTMEEDLQGAARIVEQLDRGNERALLVRDIALRWSEQQPERAADWAESYLGERLDWPSVLAEIAEVWSKSDPKAAGKLFQRASGAAQSQEVIFPLDRVVTVGKTAEVWARAVPGAGTELFHSALELSKTIEDPSARSAAYLYVAHFWSSVDAEGAAAWAKTTPNPEARATAFLSYAIHLANEGKFSETQVYANALSEAAEQVPEKELRSRFKKDAGCLLAQTRSWKRAREIALKCDFASDRLYILTEVLYEWSRRNQNTAIKVVRHVPRIARVD
ncbi:MAG: hypothetical protein AAGG48_07955 [Planctomycetota bacterium]